MAQNVEGAARAFTTVALAKWCVAARESIELPLIRTHPAQLYEADTSNLQRLGSHECKHDGGDVGEGWRAVEAQ